MYLFKSTTLLFTALTLAAALPTENQTDLYTRNKDNAKDLLPKCSVLFFVGGYQPLHHTTKSGKWFNDAMWRVTTATKPGEKDKGESEPLFPCKKDCGTTEKFGKEASIFKDNPTVGTFFISWGNLNPKEEPCNTYELGENCDPVLAFPDGWSAHMGDNPACTNGYKRPLLGTMGHWWRCQVHCLKP